MIEIAILEAASRPPQCTVDCSRRAAVVSESAWPAQLAGRKRRASELVERPPRPGNIGRPRRTRSPAYRQSADRGDAWLDTLAGPGPRPWRSSAAEDRR